MIAELVTGVVSLGSGAAVGALIVAHRLKAQRCPDIDAHELTDHDRAQVAAEFAAHTAAVRRTVSEFADALAGDDGALRAQLRQFEAGGDEP